MTLRSASHARNTKLPNDAALRQLLESGEPEAAICARFGCRTETLAKRRQRLIRESGPLAKAPQPARPAPMPVIRPKGVSLPVVTMQRASGPCVGGRAA